MVGSGQKVIVPALSISLQFFYDTVQDVLDASFLNTGTGLGEEKKSIFKFPCCGYLWLIGFLKNFILHP